jgi:hypothetical protein
MIPQEDDAVAVWNLQPEEYSLACTQAEILLAHSSTIVQSMEEEAHRIHKETISMPVLSSSSVPAESDPGISISKNSGSYNTKTAQALGLTDKYVPASLPCPTLDTIVNRGRLDNTGKYVPTYLTGFSGERLCPYRPRQRSVARCYRYSDCTIGEDAPKAVTNIPVPMTSDMSEQWKKDILSLANTPRGSVGPRMMTYAAFNTSPWMINYQLHFPRTDVNVKGLVAPAHDGSFIHQGIRAVPQVDEFHFTEPSSPLIWPLVCYTFGGCQDYWPDPTKKIIPNPTLDLQAMFPCYVAKEDIHCPVSNVCEWHGRHDSFPHHYNRCHVTYETFAFCSLAPYGCPFFYYPSEYIRMLKHVEHEASASYPDSHLQWLADQHRALMQKALPYLYPQDSLRADERDRRVVTALGAMSIRVRCLNRILWPGRAFITHQKKKSNHFSMPQGRPPVLEPEPVDMCNTSLQEPFYHMLERNGASFEIDGCWNSWVFPLDVRMTFQEWSRTDPLMRSEVSLPDFARSLEEYQKRREHIVSLKASLKGNIKGQSKRSCATVPDTSASKILKRSPADAMLQHPICKSVATAKPLLPAEKCGKPLTERLYALAGVQGQGITLPAAATGSAAQAAKMEKTHKPLEPLLNFDVLNHDGQEHRVLHLGKRDLYCHPKLNKFPEKTCVSTYLDEDHHHQTKWLTPFQMPDNVLDPLRPDRLTKQGDHYLVPAHEVDVTIPKLEHNLSAYSRWLQNIGAGVSGMRRMHTDLKKAYEALKEENERLKHQSST